MDKKIVLTSFNTTNSPTELSRGLSKAEKFNDGYSTCKSHLLSDWNVFLNTRPGKLHKQLNQIDPMFLLINHDVIAYSCFIFFN